MAIPKLTEDIVRDDMRCPYGFVLAWDSLKNELLQSHDRSLMRAVESTVISGETTTSITNTTLSDTTGKDIDDAAISSGAGPNSSSGMEQRLGQQISYSQQHRGGGDEETGPLQTSSTQDRGDDKQSSTKQPTSDLRKTSSVDSGVSEIVPPDPSGVSSYMIHAANEWIDPAAEAIAQRQRFHSHEETVNEEDNYVSLDTGDLETLGGPLPKSMAVGVTTDGSGSVVGSSAATAGGGTATQLAMLQDDIVVVTAESLPVSAVAMGATSGSSGAGIMDKSGGGAATPEVDINYEDLGMDMSPSPSGLTARSVAKGANETYELTFVIPSDEHAKGPAAHSSGGRERARMTKEESDRLSRKLQSIDDLATPLNPVTGLQLLGQSRTMLYDKSSHGAAGGSGTDEEIDEEYTTLHTEDFDQMVGRPDSVTAKRLPELPSGKDGMSGSRSGLIGPATTADDEEPAGLPRHQSIAVSKQETLIRVAPDVAAPAASGASAIRASSKFGSMGGMKAAGLPRYGSTPYATGLDTTVGAGGGAGSEERAKLTDQPTFSADSSEPLGVRRFEPMLMDPSVAEGSGGLGLSPEASPEATPEESHLYDFAHDLWYRLGSISVDSRADKITGKVKKGFTGLSLMAHIEEHLMDEALLCGRSIPDTVQQAYETVRTRRRIAEPRRETQLFIGLCQLLVENGYIRPVLVSELKRDIQSAMMAGSKRSGTASAAASSSSSGLGSGSDFEIPQLPLGSVSMKEWISSNHIFCPSEHQLYQFESEKHRIFIMSDQPDRQAWNVGCYVMIQSQTLQSWTRAHVSDIDANGNLIVVYGSGEQQMKKMVDRCQEDVKSTDDFLLWRNSLKLGSELQIYSQTTDQWCVGQIGQVLEAHSSQKYEIFHVVYNRDGKQFAKFVGKWSPAIRKVVRISDEMARFPIGTEVAIYSRSKGEWLKGVVKQCFFDQDTVSVDYGDRQKNIHVCSEHIMIWKDYGSLVTVSGGATTTTVYSGSAMS